MNRFREKYMDDDEYNSIKDELENCYKSGHWIWYIFPIDSSYKQIVGIVSDTTMKYMLMPGELEAFIADPDIFPRYIALLYIISNCLDNSGKLMHDILSDIDILKFYTHLLIFRDRVDSKYHTLYDKLLVATSNSLKQGTYYKKLERFNSQKPDNESNIPTPQKLTMHNKESNILIPPKSYSIKNYIIGIILFILVISAIIIVYKS
jgi:uncharacterized protein (DUF1810 family)